ncbi:hypothetical protein [Kiloniella majae]|uniref:hypothetical protein n=1 Tax=Kiloniella majae TaxID=1938558 RepID=UPI000A2786EA|nr:hypothetical protein [Kiloniella majae]
MITLQVLQPVDTLTVEVVEDGPTVMVDYEEVQILEVASALIQYQTINGAIINDTEIGTDKIYSNSKVEQRLGEEVGVEDHNLVLAFENALSK